MSFDPFVSVVDLIVCLGFLFRLAVVYLQFAVAFSLVVTVFALIDYRLSHWLGDFLCFFLCFRDWWFLLVYLWFMFGLRIFVFVLFWLLGLRI